MQSPCIRHLFSTAEIFEAVQQTFVQTLYKRLFVAYAPFRADSVGKRLAFLIKFVLAAHAVQFRRVKPQTLRHVRFDPLRDFWDFPAFSRLRNRPVELGFISVAVVRVVKSPERNHIQRESPDVRRIFTHSGLLRRVKGNAVKTFFNAFQRTLIIRHSLHSRLVIPKPTSGLLIL